MHVQVANDPLTARERILLAACATSLRQLPVERVVLARELREGLPFGALAVLLSFALPQLVVFRQPRGRCAGELRLHSKTGRRGDRCACGGGFERDAVEPLERGDEDRRLVEQGGARRAVTCGADADAPGERARDRRPAAERLRSQQDDLPVGEL